MSDLIDRQAAIDALKMDISIIPFAKAREYVRAAIETIYNRLEELPSAQPERKTGKWVKYDGDWFKTMFKCSECGAMIDINEKYRNFFCYHCGADMRGEQDDSF